MSTYSNISDILLELNNKDAANGSSQKSALALSNTSELEIKNLLKQIDTMIHHKKLRWERQKQELDNKLQLREQELINLKSTVEQKSNQIEQFKKVLNNMEKTSQEVMNKYEKEINILHDQLGKLKGDYVKMQRKYKCKYSNENGTSKPLAQISVNTSNSTNSSSSLASPPPNLKRPSVVSSSTFNSAVKNKTQLPIFAPLSPRKSENVGFANQENEDNSYKNSNIAKKLKSNLITDNYLNENDIEKLKKQLEEQKQKEIHLNKEKDKLTKLNQQYKSQNQELLKKIDEFEKLNADKKREEKKEENRNRDRDTDEAHTDKLDLDFYKQEVRKRDDYIKNVEALEKANHIELQFYKDEVKKYKKQETNVRCELEKLKKDYHDSMKRLELIEKENNKIKQKAILNEEKIKSDEIIKNKFEEEKIRHLREVRNLRNEIQTYTHQLADKNNQIKLLQEQSNCLEKLLKEKEEQYTKTNQELIMTVAHLEALRLENHFLRQSLVEKKSDEKEVLEVQKKYHQLVDLTEKENKRLKNEVVALTECIEALKASSQTNTKNLDYDNRRVQNLRTDYEKQIESLKKQHEFSVKRLNNEIEKLYSEKDALLAELESKKIYNFDNLIDNRNDAIFQENLLNFNHAEPNDLLKKKLNMTSNSNGDLLAKTSSLIEGVLSLTHHSSQSDNAIKSREEPRYKTKIEDSINLKYNKMNDSSPSEMEQNRRLSVSSEVRLAQELRSQKFENLLNNHIESLRANEKLKSNFV